MFGEAKKGLVRTEEARADASRGRNDWLKAGAVDAENFGTFIFA